MTKRELLTQVAQEADIKIADADKVVAALIKCVTDEVREGRNLTLTGFGTFSLAQRAARKGRNPRTGAEMDIPASKSVKFKASKTLTDSVG
jgi:DNA-binding protein HU-beta